MRSDSETLDVVAVDVFFSDAHARFYMYMTNVESSTMKASNRTLRDVS